MKQNIIFRNSEAYKQCVNGYALMTYNGLCLVNDGMKLTHAAVEAVLTELGWKKGHKLVFFQSVDGYFVADVDGVIGFMNKALAKSFRKKPFCEFIEERAR